MMGNDLEPLGEDLFKSNPAGKYRLDCIQNISSFWETTVLCTNQRFSRGCQLTLWFICTVLFVQGNVHEEPLTLERKPLHVRKKMGSFRKWNVGQ